MKFLRSFVRNAACLLLSSLGALAAPRIDSIVVDPSPIVVGEPFTVTVDASDDVTEGFVTVDFRPNFPSVLRVALTQVNGNWTGSATVPDGLEVDETSPVSVKAYLFDASRTRGNSSVAIEVLPKTAGPGSLTLSISSPTDGFETEADSIIVSGTATGAEIIEINGIPADILGNKYTAIIPLVVGVNMIVVNASNEAGEDLTRSIQITRQVTQPPLSLSIASPVSNLVTQAASVNVTGTAEGAEHVTINGISANLNNGNFTATVLLLEGTNVLVTTATNSAGGVLSETLVVRRDTSPPLVVFESPRNGDRFVSESVPLAGTVNDIIPGATVNADDVTVTINGQPTAISNRTFFLDNFPLALGNNTLTAVATDRAGNSNTASISVSREPDLAGLRIVIEGGNAQSGPINTTLGAPLAVKVENADGTPAANRPITLDVSRGDGLLGDPAGNQRTVTMLTDAEGKAGSPFTLGSRTGQGFHRVRVTTPGSLTFAEFCATAVPSLPKNIAVVMMPPGRSVAGRPLADVISAIVTDQGGNPAPGIDVTFQIEAGGGSFDGQESLTTATDLDGIARARWTLGPEPGVANNEASATFPGNPGLPAAFIVSGVVPGPPGGTLVSGVVQNSVGGPIPNVQVVIRGTALEGFTGPDGKFVIPNVSPGGHHVAILGSSANDPANNIFLPDIEFAIEAISGADNQLDQVVVLPFLDQASAQLAGGDQEVLLIMAGVPGFSIRIAPHSTFVRDANGNLVQQPLMMSSSQVKLDKMPMAPPQGSTPLVVGTLQPGGIILNPPAEVCYPNIEGLSPGDVADVFAFHHDIGQFVNIGPGTVTEDGSQVCSDPGFGIVQSGWHCLIRIPGPTANCGKCSVSIIAPTFDPIFTCPDQEVSFTATGTPAGGTFSWSGGMAVGGTSSATYKAKFSSIGDHQVKVTYDCGESNSATAGVVVKVELPTNSVSHTKSSHPDLASPNNLQTLFTNGAALAKSDDDGPGDGKVDDDVCVDLTFTITNASAATFPDQSAATFPASEQFDFTLASYNNITNLTVRNQLRDATFADFKQVQTAVSAAGGGATITGVVDRIGGRKILFTQAANARTAIHEWGHLAGLNHPSQGGSDRTSTGEDEKAIMFKTSNSTKNEINRTERTSMTAFTP